MTGAAPAAVRHVLVVDDQPVIRAMLGNYLRQLGVARVTEAAEGGAGLAAIAAELPDLVICDINMKPVDGPQFLSRLRQMAPPAGAVPVILLTGDIEMPPELKSPRLRVDGFLVKPVTLAALRQALNAALPGTG